MGHPALREFLVCMFTNDVEICGFPPFQQKEVERMENPNFRSHLTRKHTNFRFFQSASSGGWAFLPPALRRGARRGWSVARSSLAPDFLRLRGRWSAWH